MSESTPGPEPTINRLRETVVRCQLERVERYLQCPPLAGYLAELTGSRFLLDAIENEVRDLPFFRTKHWRSVYELGLFRIFHYVVVRALRPETFLETGVLHGLTSCFILAGLARNQSGRLVSIDLPSYFESGPANNDGYDDTLPPGKEPGWAIPQTLHSHWTLIIGRSLDTMPRVIAEAGGLDLFLHDSEHTHETMHGEMCLAWDAMRPGGILVCDNIEASTAFADICRKVGRAPLLLPEAIHAPSMDEPPRFGVLIK